MDGQVDQKNKRSADAALCVLMTARTVLKHWHKHWACSKNTHNSLVPPAAFKPVLWRLWTRTFFLGSLTIATDLPWIFFSCSCFCFGAFNLERPWNDSNSMDECDEVRFFDGVSAATDTDDICLFSSAPISSLSSTMDGLAECETEMKKIRLIYWLPYGFEERYKLRTLFWTRRWLMSRQCVRCSVTFTALASKRYELICVFLFAHFDKQKYATQTLTDY